MKEFLQSGIEYDFIFDEDSEQRATFVGYTNIGNVKFIKTLYMGRINVINPRFILQICCSKDVEVLKEVKDQE